MRGRSSTSAVDAIAMSNSRLARFFRDVGGWCVPRAGRTRQRSRALAKTNSSSVSRTSATRTSCPPIFAAEPLYLRRIDSPSPECTAQAGAPARHENPITGYPRPAKASGARPPNKFESTPAYLHGARPGTEAARGSHRSDCRPGCGYGKCGLRRSPARRECHAPARRGSGSGSRQGHGLVRSQRSAAGIVAPPSARVADDPDVRVEAARGRERGHVDRAAAHPVVADSHSVDHSIAERVEEAAGNAPHAWFS